MSHSVAASIIALIDHLHIQSAHIAARIDSDWRDLALGHPQRIATLSLVAPSAILAADLINVQERLQVFSSDLPRFGDWAQAAIAQLPQATHHLLAGYETPIWADLVFDHGELIHQNLLALTATHPADPINAEEVEARECASVPTAGQVDGITYRISGQGEPLLLFPLGLSPSAWEPLIAQLSQDFCVIALGGAKLGFIPILEVRGQSEGYHSLLNKLFDWIALRPEESVLEVGCGSGVLLRWLAKQTQGQNSITGVDLNNYLLTEAQSLAAANGLADALLFKQGNAESLPFNDNSFDVAFSITVMEEVNAAKMMDELIRVVKPGGRVGVVVRATDMAHTLNIPIPIEERAIFEHLSRRPEGDGAASATLYQYFQQSTLTDVRFGPQLATFYDAYGLIEQYLLGRIIGQLDEADATKWTAALHQADRDGTFYFVWPHHMAVGKKAK